MTRSRGIGHVHHEVRSQRALGCHHLQLLAEVAVLGEPGELHQAPQRELTPAPAHLRAAQRVHKIAGLARQERLAAREALDLGAQAREGVATLALQGLHLRLGALERGTQRLHERRNRDLALLERALGDHLVASERLVRHAQEQLAVGAQRLPGQGVERGAQALLGLLEHRHALCVLERLGLQAHLRGGELDAQALHALRGADVREQGPEHGAGDEGGAEEVVDEMGDGDQRLKCAR